MGRRAVQHPMAVANERAGAALSSLACGSDRNARNHWPPERPASRRPSRCLFFVRLSVAVAPTLGLVSDPGVCVCDPFQTTARYVRHAAECVQKNGARDWQTSRNGASISPFRDARLERVRGHDDRARLLSPHVYRWEQIDSGSIPNSIEARSSVCTIHREREREMDGSTRRPPSEKWCVIPQPQ